MVRQAQGECPPEFRVALLTRAPEPGVVFGSKAVGEPPLMLAISAREALRAAVAAFGPSGHIVELATPAPPEAVFWAVEAARQKRLRQLQASAAVRCLLGHKPARENGWPVPDDERREHMPHTWLSAHKPRQI